VIKKDIISKYLPLLVFIFGFSIIAFLIISLSVNENPSAKYDFGDYTRNEVSDINKDIKIRVYELCSDAPKSDECKFAIKQCYENQSCQNMVSTYQLARNKTPELDNSAFINASKEYINMSRAKLGLPILK